MRTIIIMTCICYTCVCIAQTHEQKVTLLQNNIVQFQINFLSSANNSLTTVVLNAKAIAEPIYILYLGRYVEPRITNSRLFYAFTFDFEGTSPEGIRPLKKISNKDNFADTTFISQRFDSKFELAFMYSYITESTLIEKYGMIPDKISLADYYQLMNFGTLNTEISFKP